jgi:hypothetical protein
MEVHDVRWIERSSGRQVKQYLVTFVNGSKRWVTNSMIPPTPLLYEFDREKLGIQRFNAAMEDDSTLNNPAVGDGSALDVTLSPNEPTITTTGPSQNTGMESLEDQTTSELPESSEGGPVQKLTDEDGNELYIVQTLLRKRTFNRQPEWLVQWYGETDAEATWELERNIKHVAHWSQLIQDFKQVQLRLKQERLHLASTADLLNHPVVSSNGAQAASPRVGCGWRLCGNVGS